MQDEAATLKDRVEALNLSTKQLQDIQGRIMRLDPEAKILQKYPHISWEQLQDIRTFLSTATPETKERIKQDPLMILYANKKINSNHLAAANAIQLAWQIMASEQAVRAQSFEMRVDKIGSPPTTEQLHEVILVKKYRVWSETLNPRHFKAVMEVLTEPLSLRDVDARNNFRNGKTAELLAFALDYYLCL